MLRILGIYKVEVLLTGKELLFRCSRQFANAAEPDFVLIKEALLCFERVLTYQMAHFKRG